MKFSKNNIKYFLSTLFIMFSLQASARAGGGSGRGLDERIGGVVTSGVLILIAIHKLRRGKLILNAKKNLVNAKSMDPIWDSEKLKNMASETFFLYQDAWSKKNLSLVEKYLDTEFMESAKEEMSLKLTGFVNVIKEPKIIGLNFVSIRDADGTNSDMFAIEIEAKMIDYIVNESKGEFVSSTLVRKEHESDTSYEYRAKTTQEKFSEYWVFKRVDQNWLLWDIKQIDSIVSDLKNMTLDDLKRIFSIEKKNNQVKDDFFYQKNHNGVNSENNYKKAK